MSDFQNTIGQWIAISLIIAPSIVWLIGASKVRILTSLIVGLIGVWFWQESGKSSFFGMCLISLSVILLLLHAAADNRGARKRTIDVCETPTEISIDRGKP